MGADHKNPSCINVSPLIFSLVDLCGYGQFISYFPNLGTRMNNRISPEIASDFSFHPKLKKNLDYTTHHYRVHNLQDARCGVRIWNGKE